MRKHDLTNILTIFDNFVTNLTILTIFDKFDNFWQIQFFFEKFDILAARDGRSENVKKYDISDILQAKFEVSNDE